MRPNVRGWWFCRNFLTANAVFFCLRDVAQSPFARRILFQQPPSRSRRALLFEAHNIGLYVESETMREDEWRHKVIIAGDHLKNHYVDTVFSFHRYEYESVLRLTPQNSEIFFLEFPLNVSSKACRFQISRGVNWRCVPQRQCSNDFSWLHSRQNPKQIKQMREINNLKRWQFTHRILYIYRERELYIYIYIYI